MRGSAQRRRGQWCRARSSHLSGCRVSASSTSEPLWDNFQQGLRDLGYVENQNIAIEYRSAESKIDRLAQAARQLVSLPVDVIVVGGSPAARAAQQATSTIPIVMISIGDPVRAGFAVSLARPGGNMTGNSEFAPDLIGKRLEILRECVPALAAGCDSK